MNKNKKMHKYKLNYKFINDIDNIYEIQRIMIALDNFYSYRSNDPYN